MASCDVLLPVRNAASTLLEALRSVARQSLRDVRCLVLDDGSEDASLALARAFARADPRFEVYSFPARGIVATLQEGLRLATAPFVARIDADDLMEPERLFLQAAHLEAHPSIHVVSCRVEFFGEGISERLRAYETWLNSLSCHEDIVRELFVESPLPHPSVTMRTGELRRLGGWRDVGYPEDYDLWLRAWRAGWRFAKLGERLVKIRDHARRLTRTHARYTARAFLECKCEHVVEAFGLERREVVVWGAGRDGKRAAKALRRRGVHIRALVDIAPTKVGRTMLGVDVLPSTSLEKKFAGFVVAAVGVRGAREEIRRQLSKWGYREAEDFVCLG